MPDPGLQTLFSQAGRIPLLTRVQESELAKRRDAGDPDAVRKMVEHNLRLSFWRAKKWQNRGVPYEDLVQEGVFGLERAAQKFNPERGVAFSTYATTWIDHFMQRSISQQDIVPYIIRRRRQKAEELRDSGKTPAEIAVILECKETDVIEALESSNVLASLDDESALYDRIAAPEPGEGETVFRVRDALDRLPTDAAEFIRMRHGIDPYEPHTRIEAARELGITGKEATALEATATAALRDLLGDLEYEPPLQPCIELGPEEVDVVCSR